MNETKIEPSDVEVSITDFTSGGEGVGRLPGGQVVMVKDALPGDLIKAQVVKRPKKGSAHAQLIEILSPSANRREHPCPHYAEGCPGCRLGAYDYDTGLEWKRIHLQETLRRIGKIEIEPMPVIPATERWGYRDRLDLHLRRDTTGWKIGYVSNDDLVPIRDCLLAEEPIRTALSSLVKALDQSVPKGYSTPAAARLTLRANGRGDAIAILYTERSSVAEIEGWRNLLGALPVKGWQVRNSSASGAMKGLIEVMQKGGNQTVFVEIDGKEILLDPLAFTQVNREMSLRLIEVALKGLPTKGRLLDLYGGYGMFGLAYARGGGSATVVEISPVAVRAGMNAAETMGLEVRFATGNLAAKGTLNRIEGRFQSAIVDPPYAGLEEVTLQWIIENAPKHLVYVSCHPAALARDLAKLNTYRIESVQPLDMFPQTTELETVVKLERVEGC